jgi:hypothetical protein
LRPSPGSWSKGTRAGLKALVTAAAAMHALYDLDVLAVFVLGFEAHVDPALIAGVGYLLGDGDIL